MVGSKRTSGWSALVVCALLAATASQCTSESAAGDAGDTGDTDGDAGGTGGHGDAGSNNSGGSSAARGGSSSGGTPPTDGGEGGAPAAGAGPGGSGSIVFFSVASLDGYLKPPAPACVGAFVDYGCDGGGDGGAGGFASRVPLDCAVPAEVISFDANDGGHCPFCAAPAAGDAERSCDEVSESYGDFLSDLVSASCANFCESDAECFAWEIANACGDFVVSLQGGIDEEPIAFAEEFAVTHCGVCGATNQRIYLKRPGSDIIEGGAPVGGFLERFEPRCVEQQCVLATFEK